MSGQVSRGSADEYQADARAGGLGGVDGVYASPGGPQGDTVHGDGVTRRSRGSPQCCDESSHFASVVGPL